MNELALFAGAGGGLLASRLLGWSTQPALGRVAHGLAGRVGQLRAIGNGQVPAVAALAFKVLAETLGADISAPE